MGEQKKGEGSNLGGAGRTFAKEILVPILLALVVIQFVIQAFKIPSASMEDSLLIGDFLLGLKFVYGSPIPFSHKKLPGLTDPKPGEVLIFKYPGDPEYPEGNKQRYRFLANLFLFGNLYWDKAPAEGQRRLVWYMPKDFIKRCVAQSGETITVSHEKVFIDGKESPLPRKGKHKDNRGYDPQRDTLNFRLPAPGETLDLDTLTLKQAVWIRSLAYQEHPDQDVQLQLDLMKDSAIDNDYILPYFNGDPENMTHRAVYALLNLPFEQKFQGNTVYFHSENIPFRKFQDAARYGFLRTNDLPAFRTYDDRDSAAVKAQRSARRVENNEYFLGSYLEFINLNIIGQGEESGHHLGIKPSLIIDGKKTTKYTVRDKCFFMMGDNRDNSSDSRYWGLLSKDFVKAKAFIIYFSFENEDDSFKFTNPFSWLLIPQKIRWTRIGKLID
ncbi:MAG: signal peptidase [Fibrobacteres bacterium]|nr:signal peptidase [Fibrobacterota bacterium]